jgi:hypothetical protein
MGDKTILLLNMQTKFRRDGKNVFAWMSQEKLSERGGVSSKT